MSVELDDDCGYRIDQEEAIRKLLRAHGIKEANATKAPIGEKCYEVLDDDSMLLETTSASGGPTVKASQLIFELLLWVARCTWMIWRLPYTRQPDRHIRHA